MAKFDVNLDAKLDDIRAEATKSLYAGAGVADLAVEAVREYVTDVSKRLSGVRGEVTAKVTEVRTKVAGIEPGALVNTGVQAVSSDAKARRAAIEAKITELQGTARTLPVKAQSALKESVPAYEDLAKRGELVIKRFRGEVAEVIDDAVTDAAEAAEKVEDVIEPEAAPATQTATPKPTPPKKAPAKKTTTAAKKAPAQKAPAQKAPAQKATTGAKKAATKRTSSTPDA